LINYTCWSYWRVYDRQGDTCVIFGGYYRYMQHHSTPCNTIQQHSTAFNSIQQNSTAFNSIEQRSTTRNDTL
ncbi:hypothetical protein, partial [Klebsiella pneumoniae]|uniref:hypothetical protein n=1 Tax=Klebsiella pneumoniae TaxID=573 RepID=UPI0027304DD4